MPCDAFVGVQFTHTGLLAVLMLVSTPAWVLAAHAQFNGERHTASLLVCLSAYVFICLSAHLCEGRAPHSALRLVSCPASGFVSLTSNHFKSLENSAAVSCRDAPPPPLPLPCAALLPLCPGSVASVIRPVVWVLLWTVCCVLTVVYKHTEAGSLFNLAMLLLFCVS